MSPGRCVSDCRDRDVWRARSASGALRASPTAATVIRGPSLPYRRSNRVSPRPPVTDEWPGTTTEVDRAQVRLAELVAALSLGVDLGFGQPMEHVLRQCLIALRLAEGRG